MHEKIQFNSSCDKRNTEKAFSKYWDEFLFWNILSVSEEDVSMKWPFFKKKIKSIDNSLFTFNAFQNFKREEK